MPTFDFTTGSLPSNATLTRASSGTRINSSGTLVSETTDVARYTYNPATLAIRGLLNEPQRTNLLLQSAALNSSPWDPAGGGCSVNPTAVTSPDGTANGATITAAGGGSTQARGPYQQVVVTNNTPFVYSAYLKKGTVNYIGATAGMNNAGYSAIFDCNTGAITETNAGANASSTSSSIVDAGGGWFRGVLTNSSATSATDFFPSINVLNAGTGLSYDSYSGPQITAAGTENVSAFGAQVEVGPNVSSYIPTTSAAVTRSADVLTISSAGIPDGTYNITIVRESGTTSLSAQTVSGGYVVPTDVSPLRSVTFDGGYTLMGQVVF